MGIEGRRSHGSTWLVDKDKGGVGKEHARGLSWLLAGRVVPVLPKMTDPYLPVMGHGLVGLERMHIYAQLRNLTAVKEASAASAVIIYQLPLTCPFEASLPVC